MRKGKLESDLKFTTKYRKNLLQAMIAAYNCSLNQILILAVTKVQTKFYYFFIIKIFKIFMISKINLNKELKNAKIQFKTHN